MEIIIALITIQVMFYLLIAVTVSTAVTFILVKLIELNANKGTCNE